MVDSEKVIAVEIGPRSPGWDGQLTKRRLEIKDGAEIYEICELFNRKSKTEVNHPVSKWNARLTFRYRDGSHDAYFIKKTERQGTILGKVPNGVEFHQFYHCEGLGNYLEALAIGTVREH